MNRLLTTLCMLGSLAAGGVAHAQVSDEALPLPTFGATKPGAFDSLEYTETQANGASFVFTLEADGAATFAPEPGDGIELHILPTEGRATPAQLAEVRAALGEVDRHDVPSLPMTSMSVPAVELSVEAPGGGFLSSWPLQQPPKAKPRLMRLVTAIKAVVRHVVDPAPPTPEVQGVLTYTRLDDTGAPTFMHVARDGNVELIRTDGSGGETHRSGVLTLEQATALNAAIGKADRRDVPSLLPLLSEESTSLFSLILHAQSDRHSVSISEGDVTQLGEHEAALAPLIAELDKIAAALTAGHPANGTAGMTGALGAGQGH